MRLGRGWPARVKVLGPTFYPQATVPLGEQFLQWPDVFARADRKRRSSYGERPGLSLKFGKIDNPATAGLGYLPSVRRSFDVLMGESERRRHRGRERRRDF